MKRTERPLRATPTEAVPLDRSKPAPKMRRKFDAFPDRIDIRDWLYQPRLMPLPDQIVGCDRVPVILDQQSEGACVGFALAAVINYLLKAQNIERRVSPRMLYEMARRYDEWPGENYDGSSARGAMKGWVAHGVCEYDSWPPHQHGFHHLTPALAEEAQRTPGGDYYRVMHRQIRDMHAALAAVGILYVTLMVHRGWDEPGPEKRKIVYVELGRQRERELPLIERRGRAESGHTVALVGYTPEGFIVQNSWGEGWGAGGFALLPYADYLLHATDVWVAQLGVPIKLNLWAQGRADQTSGLPRAARALPLAEIRPYVVDVGNNGELSSSGKYWTTEEDVKRLFTDTLPRASAKWSKRRVMLYLHGGLNDESAVARRIVAFREVFMENEIYPLHIMWETGAMETLTHMIRDLFPPVEERATGVADWLRHWREGLREVKDRTLELTLAAAGRALWNEMKENARLASHHPKQKGSMQILARQARAAMKGLSETEKKQWELHVVAHSAGSLFAAYALHHLVSLGLYFKTLQFMAPALTAELFKKLLLPSVQKGACPHPTLYILSDAAERNDTVGPYGKSLLYLVSQALEGQRDTPLLGLERFISDAVEDKMHVDADLNTFFQQTVDGLPSLVVAGKVPKAGNSFYKESGMTLSYHVRPPHPICAGFDARLRNLDDEKLAAAVRDYETYRLDLTTGDLQRDQPGGYAYVAKVFGRNPVVVSPQSGDPRIRAAALKVYASMGAQMAVLYHESGTKLEQPFEWSHGLLVRPSDFSVTRWALPGEPRESFWWNRLNSPQAAEFNPAAYLKKRLAQWNGSRPPFITALIHENNFYRFGPEAWQFFTPTRAPADRSVRLTTSTHPTAPARVHPKNRSASGRHTKNWSPMPLPTCASSHRNTSWRWQKRPPAESSLICQSPFCVL